MAEAIDAIVTQQPVTQAQRRRDQFRLDAWRRNNRIDVVRIIRGIRAAQAS